MKKAILIVLIAVLSFSVLASCAKGEHSDNDTSDVTEIPETEKKSDPVRYKVIERGDDGRLALWSDDLTPVKVEYSFWGYMSEDYETEDAEIIGRLVDAMKKVEVGEGDGIGGCDNSDVIVFVLNDGSEYRAIFNFGNLESASGYKIYETAGFENVKAILNEIKEASETE